MKSCKPSNIEHLENIIGKDGYVEWETLLTQVKLPSSIEFVNSKNRHHAIFKIDCLFDLFQVKFKTKYFRESRIRNILERLCLKRANIPLELFSTETIFDFLEKTKISIKQNDIFLTYALNFDIDKSFKRFERYITDYVVYCFVLEVLTTNLMKDENLFQECLQTIDNERETGTKTRHWRDYATIFQRAKIASILPFIPDLSPKIVEDYFKSQGETPTVDDTYSPLSRIGLSINITEAILEDLNNENYDNAKAGYELSLMDGLIDFSKYSNENRILVAPTSSMYRYSAFPRNWSDLYNAWNLAFVGNFKESPYYACKLLFPEVADYKDEPHKYLYPRLIGLWLHIHYILYEATHGHDRTERNSEGHIVESNLKIPKLTLEKLGTINLTYAKAYRKFYDRLNRKFSPKWYIPFDYTTDKMMRLFFLTLKSGMKSVNKFETLWEKFQKRLKRYRTKWLV